MAKNEEQNQAQGQEEPSALRGGESVAAAPIEAKVNPMDAAEEAERQQAEQYPQGVSSFKGQHEESEEARQGFASTSRARVGRVVVLHEDVEHDGEVYKAGVQDIPKKVADALMKEEKAFEPAGKKRGR